jgi:adenylate kinase family enzyme
MDQMNRLGNRICIIGPSASGKSTLAKNLSEKLNGPVLHMDMIAHVPGSNWERRPLEETRILHDEFIQKDQWVIEGQYSYLLPQRLERADTLILLNCNRFRSLWNFIRRHRKDEHCGDLENAERKFSWKMVRWILWARPKHARKAMEIVRQYPHLIIVKLNSFADIDFFMDNLQQY